MKYIELQKNIFVGDRDVCNCPDNPKFDAVIHIWRSDKPKHSCNFSKHSKDFKLDYKDGESIPMKVLKEIHTFIKTVGEEERLFIHCAAGQTRSPTISMFVLSIMNKQHPFDILSIIYHKCYYGYNITPNICLHPLRDIVSYYDLCIS